MLRFELLLFDAVCYSRRLIDRPRPEPPSCVRVQPFLRTLDLLLDELNTVLILQAVSQPAPMTLTTTTRTAVISPQSHKFVTRGGSRGKVNIKATLSPAAAPNAASYSGQPAVAEVEVYDQTRTAFSNILFKLNSTIFADDASKQQLDNIAAVLRNHSTDTYLIEGHTCDLGEETKNQSLSLERAQAVANYLMRTGVRPEQLVVLGFGETDLLAQPSPTESSEQAESTRAQNRRVGVARVAAR